MGLLDISKHRALRDGDRCNKVELIICNQVRPMIFWMSGRLNEVTASCEGFVGVRILVKSSVQESGE